jgi:hypothetical protein
MLLLLVGSMVMTACGGSISDAAGTMPTAAPTASPRPAAVQEFHGMLPYVFTSSLVKDRPDASTRTVGGVKQMRHAVWTFRLASSDPRLAGTEEVVLNVDQRLSDRSATMWGTSRLRNAGGTWLKRWTCGIAAGGDVHHFYYTFKGTGGYAGLVAHGSAWVAESGEGFTSDLEIVGAGWIETTDGSPVPPAPGPGTTPANWTPVVGIATTKKTAYEGPGPWVWDVEQSDPRVTGRLEGDIEGIGETRPDGSLDYRVESTISNEDGAWDSPWSTDPMVRGPRPDYEHFQYSKSTGSGAYEGLVYHAFWFFPERKSLRPGDTFVWSGWIEEAK